MLVWIILIGVTLLGIIFFLKLPPRRLSEKEQKEKEEENAKLTGGGLGPPLG